MGMTPWVLHHVEGGRCIRCQQAIEDRYLVAGRLAYWHEAVGWLGEVPVGRIVLCEGNHGVSVGASPVGPSDG